MSATVKPLFVYANIVNCLTMASPGVQLMNVEMALSNFSVRFCVAMLYFVMLKEDIFVLNLCAMYKWRTVYFALFFVSHISVMLSQILTGLANSKNWLTCSA